MNPRPLVLTLGDPAGIGPEIALKAWSVLRNQVPFVLLADRRFIADEAKRQQVDLLEVNEIPAATTAQALHFLHHGIRIKPIAGHADLKNAPDIVAMIKRAVVLVQHGESSALVTNPISKAVLKVGADFAFAGHTDFLADLSTTKSRPIMMLVTPELRVVPVTVHVPIAKVAKVLTAGLLEETILTARKALQQQFGIAAPRIAVSGLNPHAGENGTMGREEIITIIPVVQKLQAQGLTVRGPFAADTMFHPAARNKYDVAICMYHDQALIPLKTLNFSQGVNVTLGLPFIRTSPDHGTAFDIAGSGQADPSSLVAALRMAWQMARSQP